MPGLRDEHLGGNRFALRLRLHGQEQQWVSLEVTFGYGVEHILAALKANQAMSYRFLRVRNDHERSQRRERRHELPRYLRRRLSSRQFPRAHKSFDLSSGVKFAFYSAEKNGIRRAALRITTVDGPALDHYWEDGPQFAGWGEVVGKYPDGTPAIVEGMVGRGWVILSGVHAEAPASWRQGMAFRSTVSADTAYARTLIVAALNQATLAHYSTGTNEAAIT